MRSSLVLIKKAHINLMGRLKNNSPNIHHNNKTLINFTHIDENP